MKGEKAKWDWDDAWSAYIVSKQQQDIDEERCRKKAKMKEEANAASDDRQTLSRGITQTKMSFWF